jgi:hypothetical protein
MKMQVFISRPTWVAENFQEGLRVFLKYVEGMGLVPRTLGATDYPSRAPLDEVIEIMSSCKGAIVLGYPQLIVSSGFVKSEEVRGEITLATEWNHIEAALAYAKGLPMLVIHHRSVSRGIFERGVMNAFLHSIDLTSPTWALDESFDRSLKHWIKDCEAGRSNFSVAERAIQSAKPICPNCSSNGRPVYLSQLPVGFRLGKWKCTRCNYLEQ